MRSATPSIVDPASRSTGPSPPRSITTQLSGPRRSGPERYPGVVSALENLTVTISENDPTALLVEGQVDSHTSSALDDALSAMEAEAAVSVDLSGVTFVDSSGLRVIVRAHKRQLGSGGQLTIVEPSEPVVKLFAITGLTSELGIAP